jgi:glutathione S-transferase
MKAKLYSLAPSHPSHAARVMLELKGIDPEVVDLLPGVHPLLLRAAGFRGGTVPAVKLDGRRVQGSLRISRFLDQIVSEPPLFPAEPEARRAVSEAEAWGEGKLQPIPRRIFRWGAVRQPEVRRWLAELAGLPLAGVAAAVNAPVARRFARMSDASDDRVRGDLAALPTMLDRVDGWIADGTMGGALLNAADCQVSSTVRVLLAFEDVRPVVAGRPCAELAMRIFADYPSPVPVRLPPTWIPGA